MTVTALMIPSAGFIPLLGPVNSLTMPVTSFISLEIRDLPLTSTDISLCNMMNSFGVSTFYVLALLSLEGP